jgi:hypothetical protein
MISESIGGVCAVESMCHPWKQFHWGFLRAHGIFALSNPCVTCESSFVDDFWVHKGCLRCRIHMSPVEAVSLMIYVAIGVVCSVESMRHSWKHFRWWFLSRQWLSIRWWFLSPQELYALSNPQVNRGSSFVDDFWVHRGCLRCRIHASPVEVVSLRIYESQGLFVLSNHASPVEALSLMISESTVTKFSVMIFKPAGVVCSVESTCQPWKQFRWWFLSRQQLNFRWWFQSPQGLFALWNQCVTLRSSFVDDFWDDSDSVFVDDFGVHRGCLRCRIHVSPVEAVLLMISESQGLLALSNPYVTCGSSFVDDFWVPRDCLRCRFHALWFWNMEIGFLSHSKEKDVWKLLETCKRDPMVRSNVMFLLSIHSGLPRPYLLITK